MVLYHCSWHEHNLKRLLYPLQIMRGWHCPTDGLHFRKGNLDWVKIVCGSAFFGEFHRVPNWLVHYYASHNVLGNFVRVFGLSVSFVSPFFTVLSHFPPSFRVHLSLVLYFTLYSLAAVIQIRYNTKYSRGLMLRTKWLWSHTTESMQSMFLSVLPSNIGKLIHKQLHDDIAHQTLLVIFHATMIVQVLEHYQIACAHESETDLY